MYQETATTNNVEIIVAPRYVKEHSNIENQEFTFTYNVTIRNHRTSKIQLISRYWEVMVDISLKHAIKGKGVIGKQPILAPNDSYSYESWSKVNTDLANMAGYYMMVDLESNEEFKVTIPEFKLIPDFKNN